MQIHENQEEGVAPQAGHKPPPWHHHDRYVPPELSVPCEVKAARTMEWIDAPSVAARCAINALNLARTVISRPCAPDAYHRPLTDVPPYYWP